LEPTRLSRKKIASSVRKVISPEGIILVKNDNLLLIYAKGIFCVILSPILDFVKRQL
jgi:hypothetical protein